MAQLRREAEAVEMEPVPAVVRTVALLGGLSLERDVPSEEIGEYIREPSNLVWVDVQDPGPAELSMLLEEFRFHPLALEDVARGQQRPKVDEYKDYLLVIAYGVVRGEAAGEVHPVEIDLFIGPNYLVSIHRGPIPALRDALSRWTRGGAMLREGLGFLAYTVIDAIIDDYLPIVNAIEQKLDESEVAMFGRGREGSMEDLLRLKRTLFSLRRVLHPLKESFSPFLREDQPLFTASSRVYFHAVYGSILRILDVLDIESEMITGSLEAHLAFVSNRLNTTMKTLTVAAVALGLVDCVFDAWGMGLAGTPFLHHAGAFWGVMTLNLAIVAVALLVSWRRGWL